MTEEDFTQLLEEFHAPNEKRSKMTQEEIKSLAVKLNAKINVPLINETNEEKILIKVILKIDGFLYDNLPNEIYDLVRSAEDGGIDDTEAKRLIMRLTKLANEKIDIPYIPEQAEYIAIRLVIGTVINAARKHWDLNSASNALVAESFSIPDSPDANLDTLVLA